MKQDNRLQIFFLVQVGRKKPVLKAIGARIGVSVKEASWKVDAIEEIKIKYSIGKDCYPELLFVPFAICKLSKDEKGFFRLKKNKHPRVFFALKNARRREKARGPKSFYEAMKSFSIKKEKITQEHIFLKACFKLGRDSIYLNLKSGFLEKNNILICDYEKIKVYVQGGLLKAFLEKIDVTTLKDASLPDEAIKKCLSYFAKQKRFYFEARHKQRRYKEIIRILTKELRPFPSASENTRRRAALSELLDYVEIYPQKVFELVKKYKASYVEEDKENYTHVLLNVAQLFPNETIELSKDFLGDKLHWQVRLNAAITIGLAGQQHPKKALETLKPFIKECWDDIFFQKQGRAGPTYKQFGYPFGLAIETMAQKNPNQTLPVLRKWAASDDRKLKRFLCRTVHVMSLPKEITVPISKLLLESLHPEEDSEYIELIK